MAVSEDLLSSYVSRADFQSDTEFILAQLKSVKDAINSVGSSNISLFNSKGFAAFRKEMQDLQTANDGLTKSTKTLSGAVDDANKASIAAAKVKQLEAQAAKDNAAAALNEARAQKVLEDQKRKTSSASTNNETIPFTHNLNDDGTVRETAMVEENKLTEEQSAALRDQLEARAELNTEINTSSKLREQDNAGTTEASALAEKLAKSERDLEAAQSEENIHLQENLLLLKEANAAAKQQALENLGMVDAYKALTLQYDAAQRNAKNMAVTYGLNSDEAKKAAASALALDTQIKAIDKSVGQSQKNVGNYASAFGKAFGSIRQLAYILPGIGIAGLFNLAFEGIDKLLTELDLFGEKAGSVKDAQDKMNTALKSGESEYVRATNLVFQLKNRIEEAKEGLIDKNTALNEYNTTIGKTTGQVSSLDEAEKALAKNADAFVKMTLYKAAAMAASTEAGKQALQAEIDLRKDQERISKITTNDKNDNDGLGEFVKRGEENLSKAAYDAKQKSIGTLQDIAKDFFKQADDIAQKYKFDPTGGKGEDKTALKPFDPKQSYEEQKELIKLEEEYSSIVSIEVAKRLQSRFDAAIKEKALIEQEKQDAIKDAQDKRDALLADKNLTGNGRINAEREYNKAVKDATTKADDDLLKLAKKYNDDRVTIYASGHARQKELDKEFNEQTVAALVEAEEKKKAVILSAQASGQNYLQQNRDIQLAAAARQAEGENATADALYADGKVSLENYLKDKQVIQLRYNLATQKINLQFQSDSIKDQIDADNKKLTEFQLTEEKRSEILKDRAALELKLAEASKKLDDDLTAQKLANQEKLQDAQRQFINTVENAFGEFVDQQFERERDSIQSQINLVNKRRDKEVEAVNESVASNQDKAAQIALINAKAQAQSDELADKQRQEDIKQAKADKEIGLLKIGIDAAAAVLKLQASGALATAQAALLLADPLTAAYAPIATAAAAAIYAQIPFVIAGAVAEAAVVASKPLPAYKSGIDFHPQDGYAILGDGGRQELAISPSGKLTVSGDTPELHFLERGTRVIPDIDKVRADLMLMSMKPLRQVSDNGKGDDTASVLGKKLDALNSTIKNKRETHIHGSYSGILMVHRWGQNQLKYIEQQTQSKF